jgi:hypothetical protein
MVQSTHFVGRQQFSSLGVVSRLAACKVGDERFYPLSANPDDVTCSSCLKHGLVRHARHMSGGPLGVKSRNAVEYDDVLALSANDVERLSHYGHWQWIKSLSMVKLAIQDEVEIEWLEQDEKCWATVLELLKLSELRQAVVLVKELNRLKGRYKNEYSEFSTCFEEVNTFRANGYRFPEYNSGRLIPRLNELYEILDSKPTPDNIDAAIAVTERLLKLEKGTVSMPQQTVLSDVASFEFCCIMIETVDSGHSARVAIGELASSFIPVQEENCRVFSENFVSEFSYRQVVVGDGGSSRAHWFDMVTKKLQSTPWIDSSVVHSAFEATEFARFC